MKKILFLLFLISLFSCEEPQYRHVGQEVIKGKVSAFSEGHVGRVATLPRIWVQDNKNTIEVEIPFSLENQWKVGDSCLLIIEKYEVLKK